MKLIVGWNALPGKMLDAILAKGCEQCERLGIANNLACLVRWKVATDAAGHEIWQRRIVCCGCHARLGNSMKAADHPRWLEYPVYDSAYQRLTDAVAMGEIRPEPSVILPEEAVELRAAKPVALTDLLAAIPQEPVLACAHREAAAGRLIVAPAPPDADILALGHVDEFSRDDVFGIPQLSQA
jgi:hypothetical protein